MLRSGLYWLWLSVVVIGLDRITKYYAMTKLTLYEPYVVMPCFNFTLAYNKGAAFSFLDKAAGWQTIFFGCLAIGISLILLIWLSRLSYRNRWLSIAITLIVGGALGNLWDRIQYGHVIDFIDLYVNRLHWPVFNVADSAICVGAVMLVCDALWKTKSRAP